MNIPRAARLLDVLTLLLIAGAAAVSFTGGFVTRPWGVRISVTSSWRLLLLAALITVARHAWIRRPSLTERVLGPRETVLRGSGPERASLRLHVQVAVTFVVLTCLLAFEQIANMRAVTDFGDPLSSVWRLDWVAHQLPRDPWHLIDANIFHPELRTAVYTDAMLVQGVLAAPFLWAGLEGVVVYNALMLAALAFSGVTMFWLVRELTQSAEAGFVAGAIFAWMPARWALYPHLELQTMVWIPLALLFATRVLRYGRWIDGLLTGAMVALQELSCVYHGVYLGLFLFVLVPVYAWLTRANVRRAAMPFATGALLCGVIVSPLAIAYLNVRTTVGERRLEHAISATPRSYVNAGPRNRLRGEADAAPTGLPLFPGATPLALSAAALVLPAGPAVVAYGATAVAAADASLGPAGAIYPALYRGLIPFRGFRAADRFGLYVGLGVAVLAGFGVARLVRRVVSPRLRAALTAALVALVVLESAPRLNLKEVWSEIPAIYQSLPPDDGLVLVDLPFPQRDGNPEVEYSFVWFATSHHRRLVNGGSAFYPPWYDGLAELMKSFPTDAAVDALRGRGAQFIVIHGAFYEAADLARVTAALDARADVKRVATSRWNGATDYLYEIR